MTAAERRKMVAENAAWITAQRDLWRSAVSAPSVSSTAVQTAPVASSGVQVSVKDAMTLCDKGSNLVSLEALRKVMGGSREQQDNAIQEARKAGVVYLVQAEGRLSRGEIEAGIREHGDLFTYVSRWQ